CLVGEREIGNARLPGVEASGPAPRAPVAVAADVERERLLQSGQARENAGGGAAGPCRQVETARVGRGIELDRQIVAALHLRGEVDQRAARADIGARVEASETEHT